MYMLQCIFIVQESFRILDNPIESYRNLEKPRDSYRIPKDSFRIFRDPIPTTDFLKTPITIPRASHRIPERFLYDISSGHLCSLS